MTYDDYLAKLEHDEKAKEAVAADQAKKLSAQFKKWIKEDEEKESKGALNA